MIDLLHMVRWSVLVATIGSIVETIIIMMIVKIKHKDEFHKETLLDDIITFIFAMITTIFESYTPIFGVLIILYNIGGK